MNFKPQQYWAIIITLLFHTVLFWLLFFSEIKKSENAKLYELELVAEEKEDVKEKKKKLKEIAEQQLNEMLTSKAVKRAVGNEKFEQSNQLKEEFHQKQKQLQALQASKLSKISLPKAEKKQIKKANATNRDQTVFYVGKSRVEYFLAERYRVKLPVPVYQCEGSGTVYIAIYVNRKGVVVNAEVIKDLSLSATNCMKEAALQAALSSVFGKRSQAPSVQKGKIVYMFAAQ